MGYQEYAYKIHDIKKFNEKKEEILKALEMARGQIDVELMRFDKELDMIDKGYYLYIIGCRHYGREFIWKIEDILEQREFIGFIEEMYTSYTDEENRLSDIFNSGKTDVGEIIEKLTNSEDEEKVAD